MIFRKLSVKTLLGLVIGAAGIMLLAVSVPPLYDAIVSRQAATRTDQLVSVTSALYQALQSLRNERSLVAAALQADGVMKPDTSAEIIRIRSVNEPSYQIAVAALPQLEIPGMAPLLDRLTQTHTVLAALRLQSDTDVRQPLAERQAGLTKMWLSAGPAQLNALEAVADTVDAAIQLTDARVDQLLAVKRAAWVARNYAGAQGVTAMEALAAGKPWTTDQISAAAEARGRENDAWKIVAAIAARPDAPPMVKQAYVKATEDYYGANAEVRRPVYQALQQGQVPDISANDWLSRIQPSFGNFNGVAVAVLSAMSARSADLMRSALRQIVLSSVELAVSILLTLSGFMIVSQRVSRPLLSLTGAMGCLARGELTTMVPSLERHDEIGAMAKALQTFKENSLAMRRLEAEASAQREMAEAARTSADVEREEAAARLAQVVESLADGLSKLAEGNLNTVIEAPFAPEYERLRADFNAAVNGLKAALQNIMTHSQAIGSGTSEIASAADDMARRTEQQAAALQQTAAALGEVTATVRHTAEGSGRAQTIAKSAKAEAESSGKVVSETVSAMTAIEGSARQIGQIIGVIDEIAFQTNLLALNAGVEAARAGEAGRGFAVVAQEVRALAQRAADAAKEIKTLVSSSMQQVERGVRLVGETGQALGRIQAGVAQMNAAISEIAASAAEQAHGLAEVNEAVSQMDQTTQQNAAIVEESTAATHALAHETQALQHAMSRFSVAPTTVAPTTVATKQPIRLVARR
jgi:methyl-accepting chemotaxis protein